MEKRKATLFEAFIPIIFLVGLLSLNVYLFGEDTNYGPNQIALILSAMVAAIVGIRIGFKWNTLEKGVVKSIASAMPAILILLMIGALAGTWMISGIVPAMIYYGLEILNPTIFLFAACIVCAFVSLATGSSWSTVATVGIALLGIGKALGLHEGWVAGAVISGAYFGDKMSPLSDTTNLAPAMAGTDLITHIKYMALTTIPTFSIALLIYIGMGLFATGDVQADSIQSVQTLLDSQFNLTPALFLVPIAVIALIVKKVPAFPALLIGSLLGGIFAIIFQPGIVHSVSGIDTAGIQATYTGVLKAMFGSVSVETGNEAVDRLLSTSGMEGMLNTIWLILCAMIFGGIMERAGLLRRISEAVISMANSTGALIASTTGTCIFFNITASDQYLAIVVPGRMYAETYKERGLKPENLSRTLEDSGTVTSVLVPWNTCGATQASVLGVATLTFAPYCFFNILSPIMTMIYGFFNIKIARINKQEKEKLEVVEPTQHQEQ